MLSNTELTDKQFEVKKKLSRSAIYLLDIQELIMECNAAGLDTYSIEMALLNLKVEIYTRMDNVKTIGR